jgi:hypothetical protein
MAFSRRENKGGGIDRSQERPLEEGGWREGEAVAERAEFALVMPRPPLDWHRGA